ncbi:MAG: omptin family outer membrane protease [Candidatus Electronema sp. VV]
MNTSDSRTNTARCCAFGLAALGLLCASQMAPASSLLPSQLDIALGVEAMGGESSYAIGGAAVYADCTSSSEIFPMSELEWPLDIWLARLDLGWTFSPAWRISGSLKTNFTDPDENIIDRDWLTPQLPQRLDVYSESEVSSLDALIFDIAVEWTFWQRELWSLSAGAGWQRQHFEYQGQTASQHSPSGLSGYDFQGGGGTGLAYELTYSMPYLLLGSEYQLLPQLRLAGSVALAPLISAEDETLLLLRSKRAVGDLDGSAWLLDLSGIYYLTPWWHVKAGLHQVWIDVDGEQHQTVNGKALGKIGMEAESRQTSGYLSLGYSF